MKKNIRVYYAHSKRTYGSEKEQNEYLFLKSIYPKTICPNKDIGEECSSNASSVRSFPLVRTSSKSSP